MFRLGFVSRYLTYILKSLALIFVQFDLGFDVHKSSPIEVLNKVGLPWLIIHGDNDPLIPASEAHLLLSRAKAGTHLYLLEADEHYATIHDNNYIRIMQSFLLLLY